jgi:hypothetical protein
VETQHNKGLLTCEGQPNGQKLSLKALSKSENLQAETSDGHQR